MHSRFIIILVLCLGLSRAQIIDIQIFQDPPPSQNAAAMARYIMHVTDWVSIATISTQKDITGYPFVTVKSISDGPKDVSTGVPYIYMTSQDLSGKDVQKDSRVTIIATLAESSYCQTKGYDEQSPQCPKVMISGRFKKVAPSSPENIFGKTALFDRHPEMKTWPSDHLFYVSKIDIENIYVLDTFGGVKKVDVSDYFAANPQDYQPL